MVKIVDFGGCDFKWLDIKGYGRMLSYNAGILHDQYENLQYQPYIAWMTQSNQYDVFVDAGAYIGLYSFVAASHCKKVIAFEAAPFIYGILAFNMRFKKNVSCKYAWIGNKGQIPMQKEEDFGTVTAGRLCEYNVPIAELDNEVVPFINLKVLIKMDIEGSELEALKASTKICQLPNVHWIIDVHKQANINQNDVLKFFKNRVVYSAPMSNDVLVIKGVSTEPIDPMYKGWTVINV